MTFVLKGLFLAYKKGLSPFLPHACRFYPTCSVYAFEAIQHCGLIRGVGLSLKRLMKCQPWGPHGIDLPPTLESNHQKSAIQKQ